MGRMTKGCWKKGDSRCFPLFSAEDSDLERMFWTLHSRGYAYRLEGPLTNQRRINAHRVVLARKLGRDVTANDIADHFNRNKLDNRRENIFAVSKAMNNQNTSARRGGLHRGACFEQSTGKWKAEVRFHGKKYFCGRHQTSEAAGLAAKNKRIELGFHGEALCHN